MQKILLMTTAIILTGCAPAIVGGAAVVGGAVASEKGVSGTLSDTQISTEIKLKLYQKDPDLHARVHVTVQNGEVMLTGAVLTSQMHLDAVKIAWEPAGVKRVIDNIGLSEGLKVGMYAKDSWITSRIKSELLFHQDIHSLNFSIKTVSGNVYLMGVAQNQQELDAVTGIARKVNGVNKVTSYVKIKDQPVED